MRYRILFCRMTIKRIAIITTAVTALLMTVYFKYFDHGSTEDVLARNLVRKTRESQIRDYVYDEDNLSQVSRVMWNRFIRDNHFVSIGDIFSNCESEDKVMFGTTVLLPDLERGGVKSRTYVNISWDHDIEYGDFYIDVQYNGKALYSNKFDICTMEKGKINKLVTCPIKEGVKYYKREVKIPNYLPKGEYSVKGHVTDQDKKVVVCGFAHFTL